MTIDINISNKIATLGKPAIIVCGNSDYIIDFNFDEEWAEYEAKTARFVTDGQYTDVVFSGNSVNVPIIVNSRVVAVGVYAGDLHTTTPAVIGCVRSITSAEGAPADPPESVYNQLMELIKGMGGASEEDIAKAVSAYLTEHPLEETDPTVPAWAKQKEKPTYTAEDVGAIATDELPSAIETALAQAKASGEFDGAPGEDGTESLWEEIVEEHDGTKYDPIPYSGNMALENGKYYKQDGVLYLCNRDTENPVYNALSELVGIYVTEV